MRDASGFVYKQHPIFYTYLGDVVHRVPKKRNNTHSSDYAENIVFFRHRFDVFYPDSVGVCVCCESPS